jgi:hypothetical protein
MLPTIITACQYQYIVFVWSAEARGALLSELQTARLVNALPAFASADNLFDVVSLVSANKRRKERSVMRDVLGTNQLALFYTLDGYVHTDDFFCALDEIIQCPIYCLNAPVLLHQYRHLNVNYDRMDVDDACEQLKVQVCNGDSLVCTNIVKYTRVGALLFPEDFDPDLLDEINSLSRYCLYTLRCVVTPIKCNPHA